MDLAAALFARALEIDDVQATETSKSTLLQRIRAFIQRHLHDSHLSPGTVAAAHHISISYLHRLFQSEDTTVAAWIREQRLERARRNLADPAMVTVPIGAIATQVGFTHLAVFSRVFRAAYGIAPKDYRHQALYSTEQTNSWLSSTPDWTRRPHQANSLVRPAPAIEAWRSPCDGAGDPRQPFSRQPVAQPPRGPAHPADEAVPLVDSYPGDI